MYICLCSAVTDHQIRRAISEGANTLQALGDRLGVARQCGGCAEHALALINGGVSNSSAKATANFDKSLFYSPA